MSPQQQSMVYTDDRCIYFYVGFLCYDDGCHLRKYACKPSRKSCTVTAEKIASLNIVIDKFHYKGHEDPWCRKNCSPH